jgi:hypothetical protein
MEDKKDLKVIGQVVINLFEDNTYSIGTSVSIEETMELLADAFEAVDSGTLDGLDVFNQFSSTVQ